MEKEFVTYEIANQLKDLGFEEPCLGLFHKDGILYTTEAKTHEQYHGQICLAPLWQQVIDWFMETHQIYIDIVTDCTCEPKFGFYIRRFIGTPNDLAEREWYWENIPNEGYLYYTYQKAREQAILNVLELWNHQ